MTDRISEHVSSARAAMGTDDGLGPYSYQTEAATAHALIAIAMSLNEINDRERRREAREALG